jgi:hypothetical protein
MDSIKSQWKQQRIVDEGVKTLCDRHRSPPRAMAERGSRSEGLRAFGTITQTRACVPGECRHESCIRRVEKDSTGMKQKKSEGVNASRGPLHALLVIPNGKGGRADGHRTTGGTECLYPQCAGLQGGIMKEIVVQMHGIWK